MSATPIFDLEEAPPKAASLWRARGIGAIIGLAMATAFILADQNKSPAWHWPRFNLLLLIPGLYLATAIHELGHLSAGAVVGMDAGGISVGPFAFAKSGNNWAFQFNRRTWLGGFFRPLTANPDFQPFDFAWMVAGGPAASVLFALQCALIFARSGNGGWDWIGTMFWSSLFSVVMSLIPYPGGLNKSDGARLWQLIRRPEQTKTWAALLALQTEDMEGVRPRDWNQRTFERIVDANICSDEYLACQLMAYYRRVDEGSDEAALAHLERALAKSTGSAKAVQYVLFAEAASASAEIRKQAPQARTWLGKARKLSKAEPLDGVDAGIAMCEGRYQDALTHWQAARHRLDRRKLDSGLARLAKERWNEYENTCRSALSLQAIDRARK
jgi:hypothetical protein